MPVIARNLSLRKLEIVSCELDNSSLALLASNIQNLPLLNFINLSGNNLKTGDELPYFLLSVQTNLDSVSLDFSQVALTLLLEFFG